MIWFEKDNWNGQTADIQKKKEIDSNEMNNADI